MHFWSQSPWELELFYLGVKRDVSISDVLIIFHLDKLYYNICSIILIDRAFLIARIFSVATALPQMVNVLLTTFLRR